MAMIKQLYLVDFGRIKGEPYCVLVKREDSIVEEDEVVVDL